MTTVAYICADPGVPVYGSKGASVHVQEMVRSFRNRGIEVRLYCTRVGDHRPEDLVDVPVLCVPVDGVDDRGLPPRLRVAARERRQATAATTLAQTAIRDGAGLVYERYSLFSTALDQVCGELGIPGVLEVNAPLIDEQREHRQLVDEGAADRALADQCARAEVVTTVSPPVADWVQKRIGADLGHRVRVVPNGVNTRRIRTVRAGFSERPEVVFVGTLKPWHGVEVLIEAARLAKRPWRLRLIGDGPAGPRLREQAQRLGLAVEFRGAVAPMDIPDALDGALLAVAPYPAETSPGEQYFSPLKVYEYSAAGLPVVASRIGQLPSIVRHGETGLLVPASDPAALASAIDTLVADPTLAHRMGAAGRALMVAEHSWDAVLDRALTGVGTPNARMAFR
ncbi:MAG: glycosyltransferase family 4 protein [Ornithinimicrobium sp.]